MDGITCIVNYIDQLLSVILNMYIHYCLHSGNNNNSTGSNEDGGSLHVGRHSLRGIDG
jgi:hypothetical protein